MKKTLTIDEHKKSVRRLYAKKKKEIAVEVNKCQHKMTPKNSVFRWFSDLLISVDKKLRK